MVQVLALATTLLCLEGVARAADGGCTSVRLVERGGLPAPWRDAVDALRGELARLDPAACSSTTVVVEPAPGDGAHLLVATADGRQAERALATPGALRPVVLGLLATIPGEPLPAARAPDPDDVPPLDHRPAAATKEPPTRAVGFHVAPAVDARVGWPTPVALGELAVRFELRVQDWLVLASGRYSVIGERTIGARIPGWSYDEIAVGFGFGRRLHLGELALDVAITPEVVVVTEEGNNPVDGEGGTSNEFRVQSLARVVVPVGGHLRPALLLDAELSPLTLTDPTRVIPTLPPLPTWTAGLGAGVVWDVP